VAQKGSRSIHRRAFKERHLRAENETFAEGFDVEIGEDDDVIEGGTLNARFP